MKKTRFSESQIISALKSHETGKSTEDICRELAINRNTFYNWKKKYGGMDTSQLSRMKELEEENRKLKRMYAELALDHETLKWVVEKKL
jgi:putative transposase